MTGEVKGPYKHQAGENTQTKFGLPIKPGCPSKKKAVIFNTTSATRRLPVGEKKPQMWLNEMGLGGRGAINTAIRRINDKGVGFVVFVTSAVSVFLYVTKSLRGLHPNTSPSASNSSNVFRIVS